MTSITSAPKSSFVNFSVEHDEISQTPKYRTDIVAVPTSMKNRYESLERRNRYLGIGLLVVLLAMCAMTAFVVKEKLDHDREKRNSVGNHQESLDQLKEEFNVTVIHLQKMITDQAKNNVNTKYLINQSITEIRATLETKFTDKLNELHNQLNIRSEQLQSTVSEQINKSVDALWTNVNDTIGRIQSDTVTAVEERVNSTYIRMKQVAEGSIAEMHSLLSQINPQVPTTTDHSTEEAQENETVTPKTSLDQYFGTMFAFNLTSVREYVKENKSDRYDSIKKVVSGVPMEVTVRLSASYEFMVNLWCVEDRKVQYDWPLRKSIRLVMISSADRIFMERIVTTDDVASCKDPAKFRWTKSSLEIPLDELLNSTTIENVRLGLSFV